VDDSGQQREKTGPRKEKGSRATTTKGGVKRSSRREKLPCLRDAGPERKLRQKGKQAKKEHVDGGQTDERKDLKLYLQ